MPAPIGRLVPDSGRKSLDERTDARTSQSLGAFIDRGLLLASAMGWGVSEGATFGKRLEGRTGLRVLEAGISSYGTARELTILRRSDTQDTRYLIIQYKSNDLDDNLAFVQIE